MNSKQYAFENVSLTHTMIQTSIGPVPTLFWIPEEKSTESVIVGLHYSGGSKEIWLDEEHNPLLQFAIETGTPFIASDSYGHGEWHVEGFDMEDLSEEQWSLFVLQTRIGISETIKIVAKEKGLGLNDLHFVGVSMGCFTGQDLIVHTDLKPVTLTLSAPCPGKTWDDEYSFHNNLSAFIGCDLLILSGTNDENNEPDEVQWFFDQIESDRKEILFYESPHQLPEMEWMPRVVEFMKEKLT